MGTVYYKGVPYYSVIMKDARGDGSNPNLLINGDFKINQRSTLGESPYTANASLMPKYTVDRWYLRGSDTNLKATLKPESASNGGGVTFQFTTPGVSFGQIFEHADALAGKTVTLSCNTVNQNGSFNLCALADNKICGSVEIKTTMTDGYTELKVNVPSDAIYFKVEIQGTATGDGGTGSLTIYNVKLEMGGGATPFHPRTHAEELQMCQRYYYEMNYKVHHPALVRASSSESVVRTVIPLPVPMREIPAITYNSTSNANPSEIDSSNAIFTFSGTKSTVTSASVDTAGCDSNPDKIVLDLTVPKTLALNATGIFRPWQRLRFDAEIYF